MARLSQPVSATPPQPHVTFIMGNEAGDLDSAASAIALSYILNHDQSYFVHTYRVPGGVYVPLIQTPRNALYQRRENLAVYEAVGIALEDLLCIDELGPLSTRRLGSAANVSLGLVDHAKLSEVWGDQHVVDVIVDHHEDEGAHMDAPLRIIYAPTVHPVGSAASIVAMLAAQAQAETAQALPSGVADLLLSAIVLDTRNLRMQPDGKGTPMDVRAYASLLPSSSFYQANTSVEAVEAVHPPPSLTQSTQAWSDQLRQIKKDVSHLDTHGLLTRDFKTAQVQIGQRSVHVGLASVPISLSSWLSQSYRSLSTEFSVDTARAEHEWDVWWTSMAWFMQEKHLDMAVVLASYSEAQADTQERKSRRDLAIAYRDYDHTRDSSADMARIIAGLEQFGTAVVAPDGIALDLQTWKGERRIPTTGKKERVQGLDAAHRVRAVPGVWGAVWRQGNTQANRKIVQPALLRVLQYVL
ncbi:exopolyphosphatase [Malassezia pachydermatis]